MVIVLVVVLVLDCGRVESPRKQAGIGGMSRVWTVQNQVEDEDDDENEYDYDLLRRLS